MQGKRFIEKISLKNFLSYGTNGQEIELEPLNVIIGTNGSGKSNLIEAINLLHAAPKDFAEPIRQAGGVESWLWKGENDSPIAVISALVNYPDNYYRDFEENKNMSLHYQLEFTSVGGRTYVEDEVVENAKPAKKDAKSPYLYYRYQHGSPVFNIISNITNNNKSAENRTIRKLQQQELGLEWLPDQSVLRQHKDAELYPELAYLDREFSKIRLYRDWDVTRNSVLRKPQNTDSFSEYLLEDGSNLAMVLNNMGTRLGKRREIESNMRSFLPSLDAITFPVEGNTIQVFIEEKGLAQPVPAARLSDGTLRYLCLLAVLCHPKPPPLICIEEPEMGLHPDVLPLVAKLLLEASKHTQIIVTTHSEILVSEFGEVPEAIITCDRYKDGTRLRRLEPEPLQRWLEEYSLGRIWQKGLVGGVR